MSDVETYRLVYVDGPWASFAANPAEAWGDDWDDAPHDCNAGVPSARACGPYIKVAYDGELEIGGRQGALRPQGAER